MSRAYSVAATGPVSEIVERNWDRYEIPVWFVTIMDKNHEELKSYRCTSYAKAIDLAASIARDRRIQDDSDAMPA